MLVQHLLHNAGGVEVEEDPMIHRVRQQRQARDQHEPVAGRQLGDLVDQQVHDPLGRKLQLGRGAEQCFGLEARG